MTSSVEQWTAELQEDPDRDFLLDGVKDGFRIVDKGTTLHSVETGNYKSATCLENRDKVEKQICEEIAEGHYIPVHAKPTIVSSLGAIPKRNSSKVRLIHDCSRPPKFALNDHATIEKQTYQSLDDAVHLMEPGCYFAKVDLAQAYRSVRIHRDDHVATGLKWTFSGHTSPTYMYDASLPFGARRSPEIFHRLTQSVRRMMARRGYNNLVVFLDDFLIVSPTHDSCLEALNVLIGLLRQLGFQINWSKVEGPCQQIKFLGIMLDSIAMCLELPEDRLEEFQLLLQDFAQRKRATRRQLERLSGKLAWASRVIKGGRIFSQRIFNTMAKLRKPSHKYKLTQAFHADIQWWLRFMRTFNGKAACLNPAPILDVEVDACNAGSGIAFRGDWQYIHFATDMPGTEKLHINYKETLSVLFAAQRWAPMWANHCVIIHTDSTTAKAIINKGTCRNNTVMRAMRKLFWLSASYNFELKAVHVPGKNHILPDIISRVTEKNKLTLLLSLLTSGTTLYTLSVFLDTLQAHMSHKAFILLLPQIQALWRWRSNWIKTLCSTEQTISVIQQSSHIALTGHGISSFV